jgi:thiol:disulfide interchange protein
VSSFESANRTRRYFKVRYFAIFLLAAWAPLATIGAAGAQPFSDPLRSSDGIVGQFDSPAGLEAATLESQIAPATADRPAVLLLTVNIAAGRHTYSLTQPAGGPLPSKIELEPSRDYRLLSEFQAHPTAHSTISQGPDWSGLEVQEHQGKFTLFAPIEITAGVAPAELEITGTLQMLVCETGGFCEPVEKTISAKLADNAQVPAKIQSLLAKSKSSSTAHAGDPQAAVDWSDGSIQLEDSAVKLRGEVVPSTAQPGDTAELKFTASLPEGSRIYAHSDRDSQKGTKPVLIAIERASGLLPRRATTDAPMKIDNSVPQFGVMKYHEGDVTWTVPIDVPKNTPPGVYTIGGLLGYQSCGHNEEGREFCESPQAVRFEATLSVAPIRVGAPAPIRFAKGGSYNDVARAAEALAASLEASSPFAPNADGQPLPANDATPPALDVGDSYDLSRIQIDKSTNSIGHYIALAFVGGLLLNLMPCVLPVIGLKVMSFVEQAGKSRSHALALNLWFALGIVAVFMALALLASLSKLGLGEGLVWGGQNGSTIFNVVIASIVFAMALSLLGVWEVPIPGFFGSRSMHKAAAQEGPLGAVLKGIVTTILATPCTAPFMATAVAWAVSQSVGTTLAVFATLGLGMASPYILIGVYPELLRFLPKPGAWMETFKQVSGFVLLATVVFILSYIEPAAIIPTIILLLGIAVACWLLARTPLTAELRDRVLSWSYAGAIVLVFVAISFGWLYRIANATADPGWQPFSLAKLKQVAVDEGRTVLVDFSAEWCINCKVFERTVLHTRPVEQAIDRGNVVTMYADFTDYPEEIRNTIRALGANGVPVIAIFPGNAPYEPIVFGGGYTKDKLIAALERATSRRSQLSGSSVAEASAAPVK